VDEVILSRTPALRQPRPRAAASRHPGAPRWSPWRHLGPRLVVPMSRRHCRPHPRAPAMIKPARGLPRGPPHADEASPPRQVPRRPGVRTGTQERACGRRPVLHVRGGRGGRRAFDEARQLPKFANKHVL
jgi:hypothetical protein